MALDSATSWATDIATAIAAIGIDNSAAITPAQLIEIWTKVKIEDRSQLTGNAEVSSDGATGGHTPGGSAPIVGLAGVIS